MLSIKNELTSQNILPFVTLFLRGIIRFLPFKGMEEYFNAKVLM